VQTAATTAAILLQVVQAVKDFQAVAAAVVV
jgi:hypothetical protein